VLKSQGSVALSFKFDETSFAFVHIHLAQGDGLPDKRVNSTKTLIDEAFLKSPGHSVATDHNYLFVMGDFNFRIDMGIDALKSAITQNQIDLLLKSD